MLAYPSAFTVRTGAAHWEVLLRSRAIETQTYVIGAAAVGQAHPNPNKLGTRHGTLVLLLLSTPFREAVDCIVIAPPLLPHFR
jgi:predicted amidohydrolase